MPIHTDIDRGRKLAELLYTRFTTTGIHGRVDMPEDTLPTGISHGSLRHILFLTLVVSIDYQRDAQVLWDSARTTSQDHETKYLFDPRLLHETKPS